MTPYLFYALVGAGAVCMGLYALIVYAHLLRKLLALNVMSSGVFLVLAGIGARPPGELSDPVPHAMVLTGIVVAVAATAFGLVVIYRLAAATGREELDPPLDRAEDDSP